MCSPLNSWLLFQCFHSMEEVCTHKHLLIACVLKALGSHQTPTLTPDSISVSRNHIWVPRDRTCLGCQDKYWVVLGTTATPRSELERKGSFTIHKVITGESTIMVSVARNVISCAQRCKWSQDWSLQWYKCSISYIAYRAFKLCHWQWRDDDHLGESTVTPWEGLPSLGHGL